MNKSENRPAGREKGKEKDGEEVTALARGLDVLRRIAAADAPVSNRELTELTGIPKPTVSRITATLVGAGLLFRLPDSERFVLTASVLELSNGFLRNFDIRARARPFLIELAELHRPERASGGARPAGNGRHRRDPAAFRRARVAAGSGRADGPVPHRGRPRVSCGAAAAGATDADRERADRIRRRLAEHQRRTCRAASHDVRQLGFAISTGEWHDGLNAVAAGFVGPSGQRYAVNCGGAAHQCPRERLIQSVAPALLDCIARIVHEIGGTPGRAPRRGEGPPATKPTM